MSKKYPRRGFDQTGHQNLAKGTHKIIYHKPIPPESRDLLSYYGYSSRGGK